MRSGSMFVLAAFVAMCGACGSSGSDAPPSADPAAIPPADKVCADGFTPLDAETGCGPVTPPATCAAGTRTALGSAACVPVGVTACATGFARDATGWGCDAVIAPAACPTGSATRERLGTTSCVPVSDCNAAFPPAGATVFVSGAFTDAQLDATHVRTLALGVAAAPAGATIAVDSGTYAEKVMLLRRKVSIIGRCAEKVVMKQLDGVIGSGIEANTGDDLLLKNMTLRGYNAAVSVLGGGAKLDSVIVEDGLLAGVVAGNVGTEVHLTNVVIRGMKVRTGGNQAFGAFASAGASMTIDDSVFAGNEFVNLGATKPGTELTITGSIARDGKAYGATASFGMGVYVAEGATATIEGSAIVDNSNAGVNVFSTATDKSSATIRHSAIRRTKRDGATKNARGLAITGGHVVVEQSTIGGSAELEMVVTAGAAAEISDSTLLGAAPSDPKERGATGLGVDSSTTKAHSLAIVSPRAGVEVTGTGKLTMDASLVTAPRSASVYYEAGHWVGLGITVDSKASLTLTSSTIEDAHVIGLLVTGNADLTGTLIRRTRPGLDGSGGRAMCVQNGGTATVTGSAFADNSEAGVVVQLEGATLAMTGSSVTDTGLDANGKFGMGVLFGGDSTGTVEASTITGSKGVGVTVAASGAFVHHTTISRNAIGVHTQDGTSLMQGEAVGDALSLVISGDTRFVDNQTRVGSGVVPLPNVLEPLNKP